MMLRRALDDDMSRTFTSIRAISKARLRDGRHLSRRAALSVVEASFGLVVPNHVHISLEEPTRLKYAWLPTRDRRSGTGMTPPVLRSA